EETLRLLLIDLAHLLQEAKLVAVFARHGLKCRDIFGETGTSVANTGKQETRTDARIAAYAFAHIFNVRAHGFSNVGYGIDEGNLHGKKGVGSMLNEFSALGGGFQVKRRHPSTVRSGHCVWLLRVPAADELPVEFAHDAGRAFRTCAHNNAVRIQKVSHGRAF